MSDIAIVGLSILGGGTVLSLVFFAIAWFRASMSRGGIRTVGVVVDRKTGSTEGWMPALYPTFQWHGSDGNVHQRTSSIRQSLGPAPGTSVQVLYDPQTPSRAMIDSFVQSGRLFWLLGGIILAFGVLVGGFLLLLLAFS